MGAWIPEKVVQSELTQLLIKEGFPLINQGKVRDTFRIPYAVLPCYQNLFLLMATDRISIFDFVLSALVKDKGKVLTAMTIFWLTKVFNNLDSHLFVYGYTMRDMGLLSTKLRDNSELRDRALIVKKLDIMLIECIVRGYLTGSGWKAYQKDGKVCGIQLPQGLHDGSKLSEPIFTPSTKAQTGHDEHLDTEQVVVEYGNEIKELSLSVYKKARDFAEQKGVIIADTKFEFGKGMVLADEVLTPDSSRFWLKKDWREAVKDKKSPSGYDKQPVREWGKTVETPFGIVGINNLKPENPEHVEFVHSLTVPEKVLVDCSSRYKEILFILTGQRLES